MMANMALAALSVLVIGESHVMGSDSQLNALHEALTEQGATVNTYGMCGASAGDWVYPVTVPCGRTERLGQSPVVVEHNLSRTWNLDRLAAQHHPDLVIVELTDFMAGFGSAEMPPRWATEEIRALVDRIEKHHLPCAWVGPVWGDPYYKTTARVKETSELLSGTVAPCRLIDSVAFAKSGRWPTTDGEYLTRSSYRQWSAAIANSLAPLENDLSRTKENPPAAAQLTMER